MGQWSENCRVNGAEFFMHLNTGGCWDPITPNSIIDEFYLASGQWAQRDKITLHLLNRFFKGKPLRDFIQWYEEYRVSQVVRKVAMKQQSKSPWAL